MCLKKYEGDAPTLFPPPSTRPLSFLIVSFFLFISTFISTFIFIYRIALYSVITALGYLTFGAASNGLILNNYSTADTLMSFSRIAVALSVTFSFPLLFIGTRDGLLDLLKVPKAKRTDGYTNRVTVGILAVVTALAAQLRDLGLVASIGGATFGTALVFLYPTIMFLKTQQGKPKTFETTICKLIAVLGVAMGAIGTKLSFS